MEIISNEDELKNVLDQRVYSLGNFDGVHIGHQALIKTTKLIADALNCSWGVIIFKPHTKGFFYKDFKILSNLKQKLHLLNKFKVPRVVIIDFNSVYNLTCNEFINKYLINKLNIKALVCGNNFKMGKDIVGVYNHIHSMNKKENFININNNNNTSFNNVYNNRSDDNAILNDSYLPINVLKTTYSSSNNVKLPVYYTDLKTSDNINISSTNIKLLLNSGRVKEANKLLGYNFTINSKVIHGRKLGRQLGFPTINMLIPNYVTLKYGIYATKTHLSNGVVKNSVTSFGIRPTINVNNKEEVLETYIFDYSDDLYNQIVSVEFFHYIRAEKKFSNINELITAIKEDVLEAKKVVEAL